MIKWQEERIYREHLSSRWTACFVLNPVLPMTNGDIQEHGRVRNQTKGWCEQNFGKQYAGHPTKYRWAINGSILYFRHPDDAFAFKMRWC